MPNPKKPRSVNRLHGANSYQRIISRQREIGKKIRAYHGVQNTSISQRRTSQMIRRSPTAFEVGYVFWPQRCENISSFQTRGWNKIWKARLPAVKEWEKEEIVDCRVFTGLDYSILEEVTWITTRSIPMKTALTSDITKNKNETDIECP